MKLADIAVFVVIALIGYGVVAAIFNLARRRAGSRAADPSPPAGPTCPRRSCGERNAAGAQFCRRCGEPLGPATPPS